MTGWKSEDEMESTFVVIRCTKCHKMFRAGVNGIGGGEMPALCDKCAQVARSTQGSALQPGDPYYAPIKARQEAKRKGGKT